MISIKAAFDTHPHQIQELKWEDLTTKGWNLRHYSWEIPTETACPRTCPLVAVEPSHPTRVQGKSGLGGRGLQEAPHLQSSFYPFPWRLRLGSPWVSLAPSALCIVSSERLSFLLTVRSLHPHASNVCIPKRAAVSSILLLHLTVAGERWNVAIMASRMEIDFINCLIITEKNLLMWIWAFLNIHSLFKFFYLKSERQNQTVPTRAWPKIIRASQGRGVVWVCEESIRSSPSFLRWVRHYSKAGISLSQIPSPLQ